MNRPSLQHRDVSEGADTSTLARAPRRFTDAQAGKWLAMACFNSGTVDLVATQQAFDKHPEWAAA